MSSTLPQERIRILTDSPVRSKHYVLYWMQSSHRVEENPALTYAIERANALHFPVIVYTGITGTYPESNLRHLQFMTEGLCACAAPLETLGIRFILRAENPVAGVLALARDAALIVTERGYLRTERSWYRMVAEHSPCPFIQTEGNVVVPVQAASGKEEYASATIRPKIQKLLGKFLKRSSAPVPDRSSLHLDLPTLAGEPVDKIIAHIDIDRSVPPSSHYIGGTDEAAQRFDRFLNTGLDRFADDRNDPAKDISSGMSPYLHFGQISPVTLALLAQETGKPDSNPGIDAFLEELIVRRELAVNFVFYNDRYDSFASLPVWAKTTLENHKPDRREYLYTREELEQASTHDPYWNASQTEMVRTGKMQGYMRMYWGKKILEWSETPEDAYATALYLNNKYEIDGRDANGYTGVAWCFGKHDRPWKERPVFGMVRYMNAAGLERKFLMEEYVAKTGRYK